MADERLQATIEDGQFNIDHITVEIKANSAREEEFEEIREAVQEILDG